MGNSQKFPSRPQGVSEEKKRGKNPVRKKAQKIISLSFPVPVMQLPVTSFPVISGDITSGDATSGDAIPVMSLLPVTAPPQILARFNMIYYLIMFKAFPGKHQHKAF